jgi:hypothetical protein
LHEIKHNGFRIVARKEGERIKIWSRRGADFTDRFSRIADAVRGLPVDEALIDGEAVVLRDDGRSDFGVLMTKSGGVQENLRFPQAVRGACVATPNGCYADAVEVSTLCESRKAAKPSPTKPRSVMTHVAGSGTDEPRRGEPKIWYCTVNDPMLVQEPPPLAEE